jgi:hypothetical protein
LQRVSAGALNYRIAFLVAIRARGALRRHSDYMSDPQPYGRLGAYCKVQLKMKVCFIAPFKHSHYSDTFPVEVEVSRISGGKVLMRRSAAAYVVVAYGCRPGHEQFTKPL